MLTPKQIEELQDFAFTVTDPVNNYLISDICRRIAKAGKITDTAAYQIYRAQALGESKRNIKKMLSERLGYSAPKINALFSEAADISFMQDVALFADTIDKPASVAQTVKSAARLANDELKNITQTIGMIAPNGEALPLQKVYRACMDDAFNKVYTGAMDYTSAIRHASRHLADYGVRVIDYESGVHTSLEAAVRRNIMGGLGLMVEDIAETNHAKLECDGWELSAHAASAPDHEPHQGKQYTDAEYKALNGTPEKAGKLRRRIGTLNCGHVAFPIILGVHQPQYTDEQLQKFKDDNAKGVTYQGKHYTMYEAKQKLRELERNIRLQKRRIEAADALNDKPKLQAAQIRLGLLRREYKSFAKSAGLIMEPERTQSTYFGHSAASKATWTFRKEEERWIEVVKANMTGQLEALNDAERERVTRYTGFEATDINSAINRGNVNEARQSKIDVLDSATAKGTVPDDITLYRSTSLSYLQLPIGNAPSQSELEAIVGRDVINPIFTSTSFKELKLDERNTYITYSVPKGYRGALYIKELATPKYKEQDEVLFARGLSYTITSATIRDGKYYLTAEVLPNER